MNEFDDPVVRNALERLAGYLPDEDVAFASVRSQARVVRQRRAGVLTMACVGVIGVGMYGATLQRTSSVKINEAAAITSTTAPLPELPTTLVTVPPVPETTIPVVVTTAGGRLTEPVSGVQPVLENQTTTTEVATTVAETATTRPPRAKPPTTNPEPAPPQPSVPPQSTNPAPTVPPATEPPPEPRQTESRTTGGGSVTVSTDGTSVVIVSAPASDGFRAQIDKASGSSVRVNFIGKKITYRVRAKLDGGKIVFEVHSDEHSETTNTEFADTGGTQGGTENGTSETRSDDGSVDRNGHRDDAGGDS